MNTEISKNGTIQVKFLPEVWDMIKGYMGVIPDFPVEILQVLKSGLPVEDIARIISMAVSSRRYRIYLHNNKRNDMDDEDNEAEGESLHQQQLFMASSDGSLYRMAEEAIWKKKGKREMKKRLLRMFWNSPNKRELFHYVAWEIIEKQMKNNIVTKLMKSPRSARGIATTTTAFDDIQELDRKVQLSAKLWTKLIKARDSYFYARVFY
jgi:hypothetical protein